MTAAGTTPSLLTRGQAAEYLRIKTQTLAVWAGQGRGPAFIKVGRAVRYRKSDLDAWLAEQTVHPAGSAGQTSRRGGRVRGQAPSLGRRRFGRRQAVDSGS